MNINRDYVDSVAEFTRNELQLYTPINLEKLCTVIEDKLYGKCVPVEGKRVEEDAHIKISDNESTHLFTILYRCDKPKTTILFSVAHELGHLFLHLLKGDGKFSKSAFMQKGILFFFLGGNTT